MWRTCAGLAGGLLLGTVAPADTIRPGWWTGTVRIQVDAVDGKPPATPRTFRKTIRSCIKPGDATGILGSLDDAQLKTCKPYGYKASGGRIAFTLICATDEDGVSMDLDAEGSYDPSTISLALHSRGASDDMDAQLSGDLILRYVRPCPAGR